MSDTIINEEDLEVALNNFRDVLLNYDYSELSNVIFLDVESLTEYINNNKGNPFEKQYNELEDILDKIISYLPNSLPNDTIDVLTKILNTNYNNEDLVRKNILFNIKMDFIQHVKNIDNNEWLELINKCKQIRLSKK
jgi:hypothetical protein